MYRNFKLLFSVFVLLSLLLAPAGRADALTNLVQDPSLEAAYTSTALWKQASTNSDTPLCTVNDCGNGAGTAGPRTGTVWAWFGGIDFMNDPESISPEVGDLYQNVTFPTCGALLEFYLWIGEAQAGSDAADILLARIDGTTVFTANATQKNSYPSYTLVSVDVSSFANGAVHKLEFYSVTTGQLVTFNLDDVSLVRNCFTISGNAGVAAATLSYPGGSTLADGSGNYSFDVHSGWSGTVTPSKSGYHFSPTSRTYSNVTSDRTGQNYTATVLYTISGNVGAAGVTLSYDDGGPQTATSTSNGDYSFIVPSNWTGTVTPSHQCFTFSPTSRNYPNVTSNQSSQDYTATPKVSSSCTNIDVSIGGADQGSFGISSSGSLVQASFPTINNGPVKLASTTPILASERVIYKVNGTPTSFSEMMALPDSQLDTIYWLPWYNNKDLDTQLRFGNATNQPVTVRIWIGLQEMTTGCVPSPSVPYPYVLNQGQSLRVSCPSANNGPVKIVSTGGNIVAAERVIFKGNGVPTSYSEMIALPNNQLDSTYWLPWYNSKDLDTQLRVGNATDNQAATVHVRIAGQEMIGSPFTIAAGHSTRLSFAGINSGPVQIESDNNVPIVAAERVIYRAGSGVPLSFSEMMALPANQLSKTFWLPRFNNVDLDSQLRFANVSGSTATVHVFIGGNEMISGGSPFTLNNGDSLRVTFHGINAGLVRIASDQNIVASQRVIYRVQGVPTSFSETLALPNSQLDTIQWMPWFNGKDLDTFLRLGVP